MAAQQVHHGLFISRKTAGVLPAPAETGKLRLREPVGVPGATVRERWSPQAIPWAQRFARRAPGTSGHATPAWVGLGDSRLRPPEIASRRGGAPRPVALQNPDPRANHRAPSPPGPPPATNNVRIGETDLEPTIPDSAAHHVRRACLHLS